ncbi:hypothetical protein Baya_13313 [Bagarius yarrelli]|uniref:Uncharacterized protein n=1 Tax=Bagarius yarrelli TaxID=175774 RepID=A0A556V5N4_BAGYA|nr:hypothetical protein Baya_13313 [Bagarius yarrelli]
MGKKGRERERILPSEFARAGSQEKEKRAGERGGGSITVSCRGRQQRKRILYDIAAIITATTLLLLIPHSSSSNSSTNTRSKGHQLLPNLITVWRDIMLIACSRRRLYKLDTV